MKPEYRPFLEGVTSLLIVPLQHRRQILGHITMMRDLGRPPYTEEDETLLGDLAHRAAQAIENSRLYGEAQAAVAARDEFLSIASHELRTPLTALRLALDNLRRVAAREAQRAPRPSSSGCWPPPSGPASGWRTSWRRCSTSRASTWAGSSWSSRRSTSGALVSDAVAGLDDELRQAGSVVDGRRRRR